MLSNDKLPSDGMINLFAMIDRYEYWDYDDHLQKVCLGGESPSAGG